MSSLCSAAFSLPEKLILEYILYLYNNQVGIFTYKRDIHSELYVRAYGPYEKEESEGHPSRSRQRASPSALPFLSRCQTNLLIFLELCATLMTKLIYD